MPDDEGEWSKPKRMKSYSSTEGEEESRDVTPTDNLPDPNAEHKKLGKLSKFRISKVTRKKLKEKGMRFLFPIQYKTFDHVYDGRDVIGQARTGTGKTLSFVLPLLEKLIKEGISNNRGRPPMVLVMAPTRELVNQVKPVTIACGSPLLSMPPSGPRRGEGVGWRGCGFTLCVRGVTLRPSRVGHEEWTGYCRGNSRENTGSHETWAPQTRAAQVSTICLHV